MEFPILFNSLWQQLNRWNSELDAPLHLSGISSDYWIFLLDYFVEKDHPVARKTQILIFPDGESAQDAFASLARKRPDTLFFPGQEMSPYESALPPESTLTAQFATLSQLTLDDKPRLVVATVEACLLKMPPAPFFSDNHFSVRINTRIPPLELSRKLVALGYSPGPSSEEPGTFSRRGEVFDIFPISGVPSRMYYFDDTIEEIFPINPRDNTTLRQQQMQKIDIHPSPQILGRDEYVHIFKKTLPRFSPQHIAKHQHRVRIFESLKDGRLFEGFPFLLPLFFDKTSDLTQYPATPLPVFLESDQCKKYQKQFLDDRHREYIEQSENIRNEGIAPSPEKLYQESFSYNGKSLHITRKTNSHKPSFLDIRNYLNNNLIPKGEVKKLFTFLTKEFESCGHVIFASVHKYAIKEFKHMLDLFDENNILKKRVSYRSFPLKRGFFYYPENILVLAETDVFSTKKMTPSQEQKNSFHQDVFAEQMASLKEGDYIIHAQYGLGQFLKLESLSFGNSPPTDFITILYKDNNKVYVPVYRFDLVQKYADADQNFTLASLKSKKFSNLKTKAKKSARELAFDLLKLQAKRETSKSFAFGPPNDLYKQFESSFLFQETQDQAKAIDCVLNDMERERPMDRLICGDVGFGKTEVAMRASFKAVIDKKQVAVLVPTTILALQHHVNFTERFKEFGVTIEFLSRFKSSKESKKTKERLEYGEIDIIIGTHKLLSKDIRFLDLGLVVVDEEQRFGVNHKEKLKLLKASVDFLTLSATPIPRTLQLAFLGLKEISLIQTPPPRRQSIKSYVTREDEQTIKNALNRELSRGGQVFVVHNRVNDIESYKEFIQKLAPRANILIAHGQLPERELEKRIKSFYSGEYQVLVSTTIIENGIDMPNVNTMIVNRADRYGLSQLHQLRGRIGRSDKKAYAYFIIPDRLDSKASSAKRLEALQTHSQVGSGFNIASSDLEIRGGGDILGARQAGHIEAVGLELYTQLLKEAIRELAGDKDSVKKDIEINSPFPALIPYDYIENGPERLKYYKKLSNAENSEQLEYFSTQMEDIFGALPEELKTLMVVLNCRLLMQNTGLKKLDILGNNIVLHFDKKILDQNPALAENILRTFLELESCRISPQYSVTCAVPRKIEPHYLLDFCQNISQRIVPKKDCGS